MKVNGWSFGGYFVLATQFIGQLDRLLAQLAGSLRAFGAQAAGYLKR